MCVKLKMNVSILSLCWLSDHVKIFLFSVSMEVVWQGNPVMQLTEKRLVSYLTLIEPELCSSQQRVS